MESALDLEHPLLNLGDGNLTIADALQGIHIFGGTGSGKTSGSGQHLATNMLEAGMGGLVLTVKPDEAELWQRYASYAGRDPDDVILFGSEITPSTPYSFNFLEYERVQARRTVDRQYPGLDERQRESIASSLLTENLVNLFSALMEVSQRGGGGGQNESYWLNAVRQLLRNALDLVVLAGEQLSFQNLHHVVTSAPSSLDKAGSVAEMADTAGEGSDVFLRCIRSISETPRDDPHSEEASLLLNYWFKEFPALAPETRSVIVSFFTTTADPFLRGTLRKLFSPVDDSPQLVPELIHAGKIVVMNLPVKEFFDLGQFAQVLYKFIFQRATERRIADGSEMRPVFLWADESQFFLNSHDMLFQTTARSAKVATVYLTQSLSNYYAIMPGDGGKARTDSLLGNFVTKIFHANTDSVTNQWASELISKASVFRKSYSHSQNTGTPQQSMGRGSMLGDMLFGQRSPDSFGSNLSENEVIDYQVLPIRFTKLRSGGKQNKCVVEGFITQGGRTFGEEKKNYLLSAFDQFDLPELSNPETDP